MIAIQVSKYIAQNNAPWAWPYHFIRGLYYQIYKRLLVKPMIKKLFNGKKIRLYSDCPISSQFFYTKIPDKKEIHQLRNACWAKTTFIDIGANIGAYSVMLMDKVDNLIAFEPDQKSFQRLKDNMQLNKDANTCIEQMALSHYQGQGQFSKTSAQPTNRLLAPDDDGILVQVTTLDHYASQYELPMSQEYVLKIDVEGEELNMLKGANSFLKNYQVKGILIESFPDCYPKVSKFLENLGYEMKVISHHNYWAQKREN